MGSGPYISLYIYIYIYNQDLQGRGIGVNTSLRVRHSPPGYPLKAPFRIPGGTMGLLRPKYLEICKKKTKKTFIQAGSVIFSDLFGKKKTLPGVGFLYVIYIEEHPFMSIHVQRWPR